MKKIFSLIAAYAFCSIWAQSSSAEKLPGDFAECAKIKFQDFRNFTSSSMNYRSCKDGSQKKVWSNFENIINADDAAVGSWVSIEEHETSLCTSANFPCRVWAGCNYWSCTARRCSYSQSCQ